MSIYFVNRNDVLPAEMTSLAPVLVVEWVAPFLPSPDVIAV